LDKSAVGQFLGSEKEFNRQVLTAYVDLFDFRIEDADVPGGQELHGSAQDVPPARVGSPASGDDASGAHRSLIHGHGTGATTAVHSGQHSSSDASDGESHGGPSSSAGLSVTAAEGEPGAALGKGQSNIFAAMRVFLESFRLPGEAQQISRIMETFARRFHSQCPGPLVNEDAAFVLAFSCLMLHTVGIADQHEPVDHITMWTTGLTVWCHVSVCHVSV